MSDNELQQGKGHERLSKRRRPPLVGYVIAGGLGWILLVGTLAFTAPYFLDVILTARRSFLLLVVGFLLGASTYHLLWGRRIRFGLRGLLAAVFVAAVLCALAFYWEYLPGTLHFDGIGLPHGSGTRQYFYDSGALMNEEHYRAGVMTRSTWYKPNGEVIATTIWKRDRANIGYFLYPNGSIRTKMEFRYDPETRLYIGDETGDLIDYALDGTVEREIRDGKEITKESRGAVESKDTPRHRTERNTDLHLSALIRRAAFVQHQRRLVSISVPKKTVCRWTRTRTKRRRRAANSSAAEFITINR